MAARFALVRSRVTDEIATVTTQLRADWRAAATAYRAPPPSGTMLLRRFNRARRAVLTRRVSSLEYLEPFLETIRQEDTSGLVTQRALSAVRTFLTAGLLTLDPANEAAAIALRTYAEGGLALQVGSNILLVEVALEAGHHDLVQLLLHEEGPLGGAAGAPAPAAAGKHRRTNSEGAGGSGAR